MKVNKKFGDRIFIEWEDAYMSSGWTSVEKAKKLPDVYCKTLGFFISQENNFITVAMSIGKDEHSDVNGILNIPKGWIKKVK